MSRRFPRRSSRSPEWWRQLPWCLRSCARRIALTAAAVNVEIESKSYDSLIDTARSEGSSLEVAQSSLSNPSRIKSGLTARLHGCAQVIPAKSCCPKTSSRPTARAISRFPGVWPPPLTGRRIWPTADATCATGIIPAGAKRGERILLAARGDRPHPLAGQGSSRRVSARIMGPPHHALRVHRARRARRESARDARRARCPR